MATAAAASLESTTYSASSTHDALGRVLTAVSPDGSEVAYAYNQRGALETVDCKHRGALTTSSVVSDIQYDVRGRRESISYASNATTTTYAYDALNFRLRAIETTRSSDNKKLQGLHYHYDPVGNLTDIRDDAQQTVYFQNAIVDAANSYTYDALYRLVEATGREHATQGTAQRSSTQLPPDSSPVPMANDPNALRRYTQTYTYDPVGNLETVVHSPASGTGWTRRYQYRTDGNRLVGTSAPGDAAGPLYTNVPTYSHTYPHDVHGNFTSMPHMAAMVWDEVDQLHQCTVGSLDVYFQYAGGQRVRKYVDHPGTTTEERIYLGPFELYRKHVNGTLKEEWESLHISDDTGRIVLVETHTVDDGNVVGSPTGVWRFQLSNHLGSAATEVTETGAVISYEEYHPYGTSAYRLVDSQIDVPAKRYRYTGMERDEETGLGYHTARYYAPWLGRWTAADPIGIRDGANRYSYTAGRPVVLVDRTGHEGNPIEDLIDFLDVELEAEWQANGESQRAIDLQEEIDAWEWFLQAEREMEQIQEMENDPGPEAEMNSSYMEDTNVDLRPPGTRRNHDNTTSLQVSGDTVDIHIRSFAPFEHFGGGFEGDGRGFSTEISPEVTARVDAVITLNVHTGEIVSYSAHSDPSRFLGGFEKSGTPSIEARQTANSWTSVKLAGSNPITPSALTPPIDVQLHFRMTESNGVVYFEGGASGDGFPSLEAFIRDPLSGETETLVQFETSGTRLGPFFRLPGENNRPMGSFGDD